jgi:predicted nuclease of restriction endonuclease-like RecB superfamily
VLTADLVRARRLGDQLVLSRLRGRQRARAVELAEALLETARNSVGSTREELMQAWGRVETLARERRLLDGLCKLVEDQCEFAVDLADDPADLRREVFTRASAARRQAGGATYFDRDAVLSEVAAARQLSPEQIERALYADLRGAHQLVAPAPGAADELVCRYEQAQVQAVLLRAVKVTAEVFCRQPAAYRTLFNQLKFRRLLYAVGPLPQGYHLEIDGPLSLFSSVTKYGLQLALALPALQQCDRLRLRAQVRWGRSRTPLTFQHESRRRGPAERAGPVLPDEVAALAEAFRALDTRWTVSVAEQVLGLPGVGLCVPDLVFEHPDLQRRVYLEVLGYWSREAVFRRVELVEKGLSERILFAVNSRLRVSDQVLSADRRGALYVYKAAMSARTIAERLDAVASR